MMLDDVATQQNGVKDCPELSDIFVNARHPRIRRACGRPQYGLRPLRRDVSKNETLRAPNLMHFKR